MRRQSIVDQVTCTGCNISGLTSVILKYLTLPYTDTAHENYHEIDGMDDLDIDSILDVEYESSSITENDYDSDLCLDCDLILDELPPDLLPALCPHNANPRVKGVKEVNLKQSENLNFKQICTDDIDVFGDDCYQFLSTPSVTSPSKEVASDNQTKTFDNMACIDPMLCNDGDWWISETYYYQTDDDPMDFEFDSNFIDFGVLI